MVEKDINDLITNCKERKNYKGIYQIFVKRVIDILFCLLLLPFLLLIMIPISIMIKVQDKGPVFYKSRRLGKNFKEFKMLKFRSMKVDAPDIRNSDGSTYNSKEDSRVTRIGKFLRETSLDEIPQIFNVLLGQMSFIGPRAGDVESKETYEKDEKDKMLVRPGITGYTQAYFRNNLSVREKRLYDAWYAHTVTFWKDIKIFFKTISTVLKRDNLYKNNDESKKD